MTQDGFLQAEQDYLERRKGNLPDGCLCRSCPARKTESGFCSAECREPKVEIMEVDG